MPSGSIAQVGTLASEQPISQAYYPSTTAKQGYLAPLPNETRTLLINTPRQENTAVPIQSSDNEQLKPLPNDVQLALDFKRWKTGTRVIMWLLLILGLIAIVLFIRYIIRRLQIRRIRENIRAGDALQVNPNASVTTQDNPDNPDDKMCVLAYNMARANAKNRRGKKVPMFKDYLYTKVLEGCRRELANNWKQNADKFSIYDNT